MIRERRLGPFQQHTDRIDRIKIQIALQAVDEFGLSPVIAISIVRSKEANHYSSFFPFATTGARVSRNPASSLRP